MGLNAIIVRSSGNDFIAEHQPFLNIPLISAGQGTTDHPTQGLLDAFTIDTIFNSDKELTLKKRITLVGDLKHSRVSASDLEIFKMLNYNIGVFAPDSLHRSDYDDDVKVFRSKQEMLSETDFLISLRIQRERLHTSGLSDTEAIEIMKDYSIGLTDLKNNQDIYIMHPGPVNWGIELSEDLKRYPKNLINTQVENGVYIRMAVLDMILNEEF
jgi:aspartate carbamoyltransferase catalytic subunit